MAYLEIHKGKLRVWICIKQTASRVIVRPVWNSLIEINTKYAIGSSVRYPIKKMNNGLAFDVARYDREGTRLESIRFGGKTSKK